MTDRDTSFTNSRSERFPSEGAAIEEARRRLARYPDCHKGVYILEAVKFVGPAPLPIEVVNLE